MKALSIKQPWAWLICAGYKDIENRSWRIGRKPAPGFGRMDYRLEFPKTVYVHAGLSTEEMTPENIAWIKERLTPVQRATMAITLVDPGVFHGGIIGEVEITDCVKESKSPWFVGPYGFVLSNPKLYDAPIPYRGQLGFFEVSLGGVHV